MRIAPATAADIAALQGLREALWPDCRIDDMAPLDGPDNCTLLASDEAGTPIAFAEVSCRTDDVNGCEGSPIAFLEGVYVAPGSRRRGVGRALVRAVGDWGRARGCAEFASDARLENEASHAFHKAVGFEETERVVYFRMPRETRR